MKQEFGLSPQTTYSLFFLPGFWLGGVMLEYYKSTSSLLKMRKYLSKETKAPELDALRSLPSYKLSLEETAWVLKVLVCQYLSLHVTENGLD